MRTLLTFVSTCLVSLTLVAALAGCGGTDCHGGSPDGSILPPRDGGGADAAPGTDSGPLPDLGPPDLGPTRCTSSAECASLSDECNLATCDMVAGVCTSAARIDGTVCDDGDACTYDDACGAGSCAGTATDCAGLDTACAMGTCDASSGACTAVARADGLACDDGSACTMTDACMGGLCRGATVDCAGLTDVCNVGMCDPVAGCYASPLATGTTCDDGDLCTLDEVCVTGACLGAPRDCSSFDGECQVGICDPTTGACAASNALDGSACTDGDACTRVDRCLAGACDGSSLRDCSALTDMCNTGGCDSITGACVALPVANGTACDDGDACTPTTSCQTGRCTGASSCCSIADFRLGELFSELPDYVEIVNRSACSLSTAGLAFSWRLGCDTSTQSSSVPIRSVPAGGLLRVVDDPVFAANEVEYTGGSSPDIGNICDNPYQSGWIVLCSGPCNLTTCANVLDVLVKTGGTAPVGLPACITFTPSAINVAAVSTQSITRVAYLGGGAAGRLADWTIATATRD